MMNVQAPYCRDLPVYLVCPHCKQETAEFFVECDGYGFPTQHCGRHGDVIAIRSHVRNNSGCCESSHRFDSVKQETLSCEIQESPSFRAWRRSNLASKPQPAPTRDERSSAAVLPDVLAALHPESKVRDDTAAVRLRPAVVRMYRPL